MTINADRAIAALGIQSPVRFVPERLPEGMVAAANPYVPGVVTFDPRQLYETWRDEGYHPCEILAHELVHVRQQQDIGDPDRANWLYHQENRVRGYQGNRFEVEANRIGERLAGLIEVAA